VWVVGLGWVLLVLGGTVENDGTRNVPEVLGSAPLTSGEGSINLS
jgi:hypothetical protein